MAIDAVLAQASTYTPDFTPITSMLQKFFTVLSTLLGGLFGLYFIYLLLKFFYDRKILKEVQSLRKEVAHLSKKLEKK